MQIRHSLLLAALLPPATAQIQYSLASNAAPARIEHGLVYDSARNRTIMFGESPLTRAQREMIAVVTSQANDCFY